MVTLVNKWGCREKKVAEGKEQIQEKGQKRIGEEEKRKKRWGGEGGENKINYVTAPD